MNIGCRFSSAVFFAVMAALPAVPASAQIRAGIPFTITNQFSRTVKVYWYRNGVPLQPLGEIAVGDSKTITVTPGDSIAVRNPTRRSYFTWRPARRRSVVVGANDAPPKQPQLAQRAPLLGQPPRLGPQNPLPKAAPGRRLLGPFGHRSSAPPATGSPASKPQPSIPQPSQAPTNPKPVQPQPAQPQPAAKVDLAIEAQQAVDYLNAVRQKPLTYAKELGFDTSVIPVTAALRVDERLTAAAQRKAVYMAANSTAQSPFATMAHVLTIDGEQVGMNKWMRDAGYKVPKNCPDSDTNFECLAGQGLVKGCGVQAMQMLLKDPPHRIPMTGGNDFWKPCSDIGIGIAINADGRTMSMSVLVAYEE